MWTHLVVVPSPSFDLGLGVAGRLVTLFAGAGARKSTILRLLHDHLGGVLLATTAT